MLAETTKTSTWSPVRSKMKLFAKVMNGLKVVTLKAFKKDISIF